MVRIQRLRDSSIEAPWPEIEVIFFASAPRRDFADAAARRAFRAAWLDPYRAHWPDLVWIARDDADGAVAGYLAGCLDSRAARPILDGQPDFPLFADLFERYPAHFHVNCRAARRGRGIGAALVAAFLAHCRACGAPGVHLVTATGARNVSFYRRQGFNREIARVAGDREVLFLGRRL